MNFNASVGNKSLVQPTSVEDLQKNKGLEEVNEEVYYEGNNNTAKLSSAFTNGTGHDVKVHYLNLFTGEEKYVIVKPGETHYEGHEWAAGYAS